MSEKSLRAAEQLRIDYSDNLGKIIEAGYHCAMTNNELFALMDEQGIERPSEESLNNLRGEYSDLVEAAYGIDGGKARQSQAVVATFSYVDECSTSCEIDGDFESEAAAIDHALKMIREREDLMTAFTVTVAGYDRDGKPFETCFDEEAVLGYGRDAKDDVVFLDDVVLFLSRNRTV